MNKSIFIYKNEKNSVCYNSSIIDETSIMEINFYSIQDNIDILCYSIVLLNKDCYTINNLKDLFYILEKNLNNFLIFEYKIDFQKEYKNNKQEALNELKEYFKMEINPAKTILERIKNG